MLDSYPDGHMSREGITNWLANYQAEIGGGSDPAWREASRRIRMLFCELVSGLAIRPALIAVSRRSLAVANALPA